MHQDQKGISLIITFLIMTIMLAMVLSMTTILFNEIKVIFNIGSSVSSFNSAVSGIEKTVYFDEKQIPNGATRGLCNICNSCSSSDCTSCVLTPIAANGCSIFNCTNCQITYNSSFNGRNYSVDAKVTPDPLNANIYNLNIISSGFYKNTTRIVNYLSSKYVAQNTLPSITKISPTSKKKYGPGFTLTITGTNFIASSVGNFNGSPRTTTFTNSTHIKISIPASDLFTVGTYPITVTNPAPGGGTSNAKIFTVRP